MRKVITKNWVRISKKQARSRYNTNQDIYITPCKANPENPFVTPTLVNHYKDFDSIVFWYTKYNCCNELGDYPAYYITRKEYNERVNNF